ncbi:hypothetical protein G6F68_019474 [Rhizopus microsporus]|nr:hypothetical protein G6F68_019474 [Rhizopus microsporus]
MDQAAACRWPVSRQADDRRRRPAARADRPSLFRAGARPEFAFRFLRLWLQRQHRVGREAVHGAFGRLPDGHGHDVQDRAVRRHRHRGADERRARGGGRIRCGVVHRHGVVRQADARLVRGL